MCKTENLQIGLLKINRRIRNKKMIYCDYIEKYKLISPKVTTEVLYRVLIILVKK